MVSTSDKVNINEFLTYLRGNLKQDKLKEHSINIVLGNLTCDLDSAVSALVYSFYLNCNQNKLQTVTEGDLYIPVLNITRNDIYLKTEVVFWLTKQNVDIDLLFFRDDINLGDIALKYGNKFHLILVDHHILGKKDIDLEKCVKSILDHRPIDTQNWKYNESINKRIEQVASCATIVCSEIIKHSLSFLKSHLDCTALLYGTILLDSVNLLPAAGRTKQLDLEIIDYLENVLKVENFEEHRTAVFSCIMNAKMDISKLTPLQLLNKDCKTVGEILIPVIPLLIKDFLKRENVFDVIHEFLQNQNVKIAVLLGFSTSNNGLARDLAIYFENFHPFVKTLMAKLLNNKEPMLELKEKLTLKNLVLYEQCNVKASRKQILPIVAEVCEEYKLKL